MQSIITEVTSVFLNFDVGQQYVQLVIQLIGIVFFAEFVTIFLEQAAGDLKNVGKIFEYIVKLYLIAYSLPMIITLFELILSIM